MRTPADRVHGCRIQFSMTVAARADTGYHRGKSRERKMFERTYYATHPDMMECVSNEELRDRYLVQNLFREGAVVLNYTHADRLVIGGVQVGTSDVRLPQQTEPASAAGHPFLERRELAIVNVGKAAG